MRNAEAPCLTLKGIGVFGCGSMIFASTAKDEMTEGLGAGARHEMRNELV